jgi:hypothetical protein
VQPTQAAEEAVELLVEGLAHQAVQALSLFATLRLTQLLSVLV